MARRAGFQQRVFVLTTVSDINSITEQEIDAGTEITDDLPNPVNFTGTSNSIDISDIGDRIDKSMLGTFTPGTLEFEVYRDDESEAAYDALVDESTRYIVKFEGGAIAGADPAEGDTYDAVAVTVGTKNDVSSGRNESRRAMVPCFVHERVVDKAVGGASSS